MYPNFVRTSNVERFLAAVTALDKRGAPEACMTLVTGGAGFGKSRAASQWAIQNDAVFIRIKAAATPHWVLADLVRELGNTDPAHTSEKLYAQAIGILARERRPIVLDEVENAIHDIKTLDTMRDVTDFVEVPLILIGREKIRTQLQRHRQIWSRISSVAEFAPATEADVAKCAAELSEVPIDDGVIRKIAAESEGLIREIVKAIANAERIGKRHDKKKVTLDMVGATRLTQDWQTRRRGADAKVAT